MPAEHAKGGLNTIWNITVPYFTTSYLEHHCTIFYHGFVLRGRGFVFPALVSSKSDNHDTENLQ
jgi:hypothetical protein